MSGGELILLVDDIPDHLSAYERTLVSQGFRVTVARTGREALLSVDEAVPECAVIDLRLPDMTGWDLCHQLKAGHARERIRIIVLTPDVSRMCASDSVKAGCHAWLAHPTAAADLARAVRHVLDLHQTEPTSEETALLGQIPCPACDSYEIRSTLRIGLIQYYGCRRCSFRWRVEALEPERSR